MTRDNDNKRGNADLTEPYDQKVEARFDKEARAKLTSDGRIDGRRMNKSHASDGGPNKT
jgi:hypothetical protein